MNYLRIKKNTQYQKLFKKGKRFYAPRLTLLVLPSDAMKMGLALTKKHGHAVRRNHIKRLLREAFMQTSPQLLHPCEIIVLPKVCDDYSFEEFKKSFLTCFSKINKSCP